MGSRLRLGVSVRFRVRARVRGRIKFVPESRPGLGLGSRLWLI